MDDQRVAQTGLRWTEGTSQNVLTGKIPGTEPGLMCMAVTQNMHYAGGLKACFQTIAFIPFAYRLRHNRKCMYDLGSVEKENPAIVEHW